jgi:hypothetical protein
MAHRASSVLALQVLMIAMLLSPLLVRPTLADDKVTLTVTSDGLPSPIQVRLFVNGSAIPTLLNSSSPVVLRLDRGVTISISSDERVEGQWGFIYVRGSITLAGSNEPVSTLILSSDTSLVVHFETSHILMQPIFWPLYCIVAATAVLIAVRRWARRDMARQSKSEESRS